MTENNHDKPNLDLDYFTKHDRFFDFFKNTDVRKDIYSSKESAISIVLDMIFLVILIVAMLKTSDVAILLNGIKDLLGLVVGGLFGMLGFIIGGLALVVGTLNVKEVKVINEKNGFSSLLGILFRFYFVGVITAITIFLSIITYIILLIEAQFCWVLFILFALTLIYFVIFSIISSVMLMGSCIRLLFVKIKVSDVKTKEDRTKK